MGGKTVDTYDTDFGYRFFKFDAAKGFSLNGEVMKIKGVCMHHDQGALGSVSTRDALERQVKILKDMGCNSIRTSHNTPARELVEVCNEQGMLLDLEFFDGWTAQKNGNSKDYARFFNKAMGESKLLGAEASKPWARFDLEQSIARDFKCPGGHYVVHRQRDDRGHRRHFRLQPGPEGPDRLGEGRRRHAPGHHGRQPV